MSERSESSDVEALSDETRAEWREKAEHDARWWGSAHAGHVNAERVLALDAEVTRLRAALVEAERERREVTAEQSTPSDVEALARVLFDTAFPGEREGDPYWYQAYRQDWRKDASRFLESDWLAAREAAAEKRGAVKALREAADYCTPAQWTGPAATLIHLNHWLTTRADRIEGR